MRCLLFSREGQERDIPAALYRDRYLSLVTCAVAGYAAGKDLAPLGNEEPEGLHVLVIDERRLVHAEAANLFPNLESSLPVRASAVSAVPASGVRRPFR